MNDTTLQSNFQKFCRSASQWLTAHSVGYGAVVLFCILAGLSALVNLNMTAEIQQLAAGEIAAGDIIADSGFMFEDAGGTRARKEQARAMQPLVCDIVPDSDVALRDRVKQILSLIHAANTPELREKLRTHLAEESGDEISLRIFSALGQEDTQNIITNHILPFLALKLRQGVIADSRMLANTKGGVLVRNAKTKTEILFPDTQAILDINALNAEMAQMVRGVHQGSNLAKRAAMLLVGGLVAPSLSPNEEATAAKAEEAVAATAPVQVQVQKGELIVRQGERVSKEQQMKIQSLRQRKSDRFKGAAFFGTLLTALLIASGLFFSPSGKAPSPILQKDIVFIAVLVALIAVLTKGLVFMGQHLAATYPSFPADALAYLVPVAGASALAALVFSTRRYVVMGLLLAFFCSIMWKASLWLFLFYFLSAMWNTLLIVRTQNRQNVVMSLLPLLAALLAMWTGVTFAQGGLHTRYLPEAIVVLFGGFLSLFMVFSLAPLVEIIFGYSTRFRLMELVNLDQPVLRELMINAPGTYHHSLIVTHLAEAGANAIGAQGLLCKVAALYHDVGKITRPDYFIENQFHQENPHDKLAPSMSALILTAHVKKGMELALSHRLGMEVAEIICQHHGTGSIQFFYKKAQELGENPKIEDYSYPGPKPQTREAAIVMLADSIEASSRSMDEPTPSRLQNHIDTIIKGTFANGQLDESALTFQDLDKLAQSFLRVLTGLFHHRIKYPEKAPVKPALQAELGKQLLGKGKSDKSDVVDVDAARQDLAVSPPENSVPPVKKMMANGTGNLPPLQ